MGDVDEYSPGAQNLPFRMSEIWHVSDGDCGGHETDVRIQTFPIGLPSLSVTYHRTLYLEVAVQTTSRGSEQTASILNLRTSLRAVRYDATGFCE